jgi:hypothetical protein
MDLKRAQKLARKVGARITRIESTADPFANDTYEIKLGVPNTGLDVEDHSPRTFKANTVDGAIQLALLESAKAARALINQAKLIFVDEDLLL